MHVRRWLAMAFAAVAILVVVAGPASAHATLVEAVPADGARLGTGPSTVELHFSEDVTISGDSVRVMGTNGKRVDDGRPRSADGVVSIGLDGSLPDDTYVVAWRVVSADSHPIHGATTFVVGNGERASDTTIAGLLGDEGDGAWPVYGAIARALAYAGGLVVIGAVAWAAFVEPGPWRRAARNLVVVGAAVGAVGALVTIPVQAALSTGLGVDAVTDGALLRDVVKSPLGVGVLLTLVGLALVVWTAQRQPRPSLSAAVATAEAPTGVAASLLARPLPVAGALLIAAGFARSGHTESTHPVAVMYGTDVVHVLTAGAWLGGLALLALELRAARRGHLAPPVVAERVARFSMVATVVSIAAAAAGVVLAWGTVRHLHALTSTAYGRTLLVKTALVALVGVAAFYNKRTLVPAVHRHADARALLARTVRAELVGLLAVVAVTGALVNMEPARVAGSGGLFEQTVAFGPGRAVIQVDPAEAGDNAVHVYLLNATGGQLDLTATPTFSFTLDAKDVGPIERTPYRAGPGHYSYDGPDLAIPGTWTVQVTGRVSQFEEATATVEVPIR